MLWQILAVGVNKSFSYMDLEKTIRVAKARKSEKNSLLVSLMTVQLKITCPTTRFGGFERLSLPIRGEA